MIVEFSKKFLKDVGHISDNNLKDLVGDAILIFENAENLSQITNVNKLKGHSDTYRFRIGKYRIGFYYDGSKVEMERFVSRSTIYKVFP